MADEVPDDLITLASNPYQAVLGKKEIEIVQDAENFLSRPLPSNSAERNAYAFHNLRIQNLINQLKANVSWARHGRRNTLKVTENKLRGEAREDGAKDKDERATYCYNNAKWRDINDSVEKLNTMHERLHSMEWMLKSGLQYVGKLGDSN